MSDEKQQVTRRQFLNYTLTGVGGFMAAGLLISPLRMAIDPVLQPSKKGDLANVGLAVDDIKDVPTRVDWKIDQVDAWYESEVSQTAWVYKNEKDEIVALSPICTHLGCTVSWEGNDQFPNEFYCPCHGGRYTKDGTNIPGTPPLEPLHQYEQKVKDGMLYLGNPHPRGEA
ncbi:ubiquinol-cytochrome c reductase iron-sulfur subunit [Virgibacillus sp. 179-BFC.A HS]|uniref:Ubiquinol-cytochrome c reductase iron-sulfur subunit n=1 Tax=Tigheibacillus jepli TaxID=3035914 RepID=A0ABU5CH84_9BACI|nr:ubiquinol-cytochrome c reductase iron-sulfur subunit [Virgibacillus sp. 179-BFC.A HS]MDY0405709.1 ubiquinol-cytochrome c reductase iron-sulfur subunit [Virgibacillus sp. 179-BFC.A HS]